MVSPAVGHVAGTSRRRTPAPAASTGAPYRERQAAVGADLGRQRTAARQRHRRRQTAVDQGRQQLLAVGRLGRAASTAAASMVDSTGRHRDPASSSTTTASSIRPKP